MIGQRVAMIGQRVAMIGQRRVALAGRPAGCNNWKNTQFLHCEGKPMLQCLVC